MSAAPPVHPEARPRIIALWVCVGLFLLRVVAQIEVLLLGPAWLPPMDDWYSGLFPYPLLLPAQIGLLMLMSILAWNATHRLARSRPNPLRAQKLVRGLALAYFTSMLLRLTLGLARGAEDVIAADGIPIAFHWVLALFVILLARPHTSN